MPSPSTPPCARRRGGPLPCLGTTHADYFHGDVPLTRPLTPREIKTAYEDNTGRGHRRAIQGTRSAGNTRRPRRPPRALHLGQNPDEALHNSPRPRNRRPRSPWAPSPSTPAPGPSPERFSKNTTPANTGPMPTTANPRQAREDHMNHEHPRRQTRHRRRQPRLLPDRTLPAAPQAPASPHCKAGLPSRRDPDHHRERNRRPARPRRAQGGRVQRAVVYLGNFGPEGPTTIFAQRFGGPVMFCAAAEETARDLVGGRGDAFCGMLNASYNLGLRKLRRLHPGDARRAARRSCAGDDRRLRGRRPRRHRREGPQDLHLRPAPAGLPRLQRADQAALRPGRRGHGELRARPVRPLPRRPRTTRAITAVAKDMAEELGAGNTYPDLLPKLAQFEVALDSVRGEQPGRRAVRRLRRQVLAGVRDGSSASCPATSTAAWPPGASRWPARWTSTAR